MKMMKMTSEDEEEVCSGAGFFERQAVTSGGCVTGSCFVLMIPLFKSHFVPFDLHQTSQEVISGIVCVRSPRDGHVTAA